MNQSERTHEIHYRAMESFHSNQQKGYNLQRLQQWSSTAATNVMVSPVTRVSRESSPHSLSGDLVVEESECLISCRTKV